MNWQQQWPEREGHPLSGISTVLLPSPDTRRAVLRQEVAILDRRHASLARAIAFTYTALLAFVMTSLLYLTKRQTQLPEALPVVSFSVGVWLLGATALLVLASLRLSRRAIKLERQELFD
ncbi:DUF2721 domain-containing protein [Myxococcus xanthus]|uniref:DUF2721 domain-containing protein n=1 Tax=Myxococcus xanthus TaxID=34 RepID=UPI001CEDC562|nr:DUF2721 domain-containing protein [Myxococcus xanthus]